MVFAPGWGRISRRRATRTLEARSPRSRDGSPRSAVYASSSTRSLGQPEPSGRRLPVMPRDLVGSVGIPVPVGQLSDHRLIDPPLVAAEITARPRDPRPRAKHMKEPSPAVARLFRAAGGVDRPVPRDAA